MRGKWRSFTGFSMGVLVLLQLLIVPVTAFAGENETAEKELNLHAQSAVLMDGDSGRVLYEKNGGEIRPMASTTKIMTCILALENGNPEDLVEVSAYAASMPDVQLNIREGERYRLEDLLYSLMLESHNDSAVAIAEHIGGTVEGFAEMMNQKARDLGCEDTCFVTPNGLDKAASDGTVHSTTAKELAAIMRYCTKLSPKREEFLEITRTSSRSFSDVDQKRSFYCGNHNAFLTMSEQALSGKTGFTGNAGYCYVGAVEDGDRSFMVALLGCGWPPHKTYKWSDMKKLTEYGLDHYRYQTVEEELPDSLEIPVEDGKADAVLVKSAQNPSTEDLKFLLGGDEKITVKNNLPDVLWAPVEKGQTVGSCQYFIGDYLAASYPICAAEYVGARDLGWYLNHVFFRYIFE